ncbi:hypothetical protein BDR03DRAFT_952694 [Suillus americanus]|nr:hypothetical protein BDR03DRAFT_952694 [Suillus americanus]
MSSSALFTPIIACRPHIYASGLSLHMHLLLYIWSSAWMQGRRPIKALLRLLFHLIDWSLRVWYLGTWLNPTFICSTRVSLHRSVG